VWGVNDTDRCPLRRQCAEMDLVGIVVVRSWQAVIAKRVVGRDEVAVGRAEAKWVRPMTEISKAKVVVP
jgi:hypothetical protein